MDAQEIERRRVRLKIIGETVTPLSADETVSLIHQQVSKGDGITIANLNLHAAYLLHKDAQFAKFTREAEICLCDGMPIIKLLENRHFRSAKYRIGSTDWVDELIKFDQGKIKFVSIGGTRESAQRAQERILQENPLMKWEAFEGFDDTSPISNTRLMNAIVSADVVLVGMGMPRQEKWISEHRKFLEGKVVANVGGCMDYYAGEQPLAPRWLGNMGLEWAYRLLRSPRRLAKRYLIEPFLLIFALGARKLKKNS